MSGLENRLSYSLSALDYETDGFVVNDAAEKAVYDLFTHGQVSTGSSIQANARRTDFSVGQTISGFDPTAAEQTTIAEESDSIRVSGHHMISPGSDWIWSAIFEDRQRRASTFPDDFVFTGVDATTASLELQNLLRVGRVQLVTGIGYVEERDEFLEDIDVSVETANAYAYGQWHSNEHDLGVVAGISGDWFDLDNSAFPSHIKKNRINPKLGIVWTPGGGTTLRAAAFSSLRRPFARNQTIEPTQVAAFNQFFTGFDLFFGDPLGAESNRVALAVDQRFSSSMFGGLEIARRNLEVPQLTQETDFEWNETTAQAYWYKSFSLGANSGQFAGWQGAISLEGEYERLDRLEFDTGFEGILDLETIRAPVAMRLFTGRGLTVRMAVTYVEQDGDFLQFIGSPVVPKQDSGWITDISIEYQLPKRLGSIAVGVNNVFDEFVELLDVDPMNPRVATRQLAFAKIRLNF